MAEAAAKEPSMEDILSSIRKIIAEEETSTAPKPVEASPSTSAFEEPVQQVVAETREEPAEIEVPVPVREETAQPASVASEPVAPMQEPEPAPAGTVGEMSLASIAAGFEQTDVPLPPASGLPEVSSVAADTEPYQEMASEPVYAPEPFEQEVSAAPVQHEPAEISEPVAAEPVHEQVEFTPVQAEVDMAAAVSAPEPEIAEHDMAREEAAFRGALMSPSADGAVSGSFDRLKRSAMDDIEAKTEAILRPMLREWLDENLPKMVEKLVREEIERVARG